jgi:plasmid maintenance system antidote protein VapI
MGDLSDFKRGQIVGAHLDASVTKMATLLGIARTGVSKVVKAYTSWECITR